MATTAEGATHWLFLIYFSVYTNTTHVLSWPHVGSHMWSPGLIVARCNWKLIIKKRVRLEDVIINRARTGQGKFTCGRVRKVVRWYPKNLDFLRSNSKFHRRQQPIVQWRQNVVCVWAVIAMESCYWDFRSNKRISITSKITQLCLSVR